MTFIQYVRKAQGCYAITQTAAEARVRRNAVRRLAYANDMALRAWDALSVRERRLVKACDGVFVNKHGYVEFVD